MLGALAIISEHDATGHGGTMHHTAGTHRVAARYRAWLLAAVFGSSGAAAALAADGQPRLSRGQAIAEAQCGACHAVGLSDPSPTRINVNTAFRDLHKRYPIPMLVNAIRDGVIEGHDEMPAFRFSQSAMTDLLMYIDSLSPEAARKYIKEKP